jgi:hypothetical protein
VPLLQQRSDVHAGADFADHPALVRERPSGRSDGGLDVHIDGGACRTGRRGGFGLAADRKTARVVRRDRCAARVRHYDPHLSEGRPKRLIAVDSVEHLPNIIPQHEWHDRSGEAVEVNPEELVEMPLLRLREAREHGICHDHADGDHECGEQEWGAKRQRPADRIELQPAHPARLTVSTCRAMPSKI